MTRYNHALSIAFEVTSNEEQGEDISGGMLREAILKRLNNLNDNELVEAVGAPYDTYIEQNVREA